MIINANVSSTTIPNEVKANATEGDTPKTSFLDTLKEKLDEVNNQQIASDDITQKFVSGDETDIHKVMLATAEAKLSLETAVQIRNKLVDAYDAFNKMQI
ncbi:MAG TPA: flagellar hook-basal body complex protein FliE [Clostridium sp.]|uniref:flagellar hook-basal body complex protein FliE n=1 Tax=Clostridium sp. TaxID=1506 RepID=UPI002F95F3BD